MPLTSIRFAGDERLERGVTAASVVFGPTGLQAP